MGANAAGYGFVQPYTEPDGRGVAAGDDGFARGGHQEERWHFSYLPLSLALQRMYEVRSDELLPRVAEAVMAYLTEHASHMTEKLEPPDDAPEVDGEVDPFAYPHEITAETLLAAMRAVDIMSYVSHVSQTPTAD